MTDRTFPELDAATTPLDGADIVPVSQSGGDAKKVSVANLTAGRNVDGTAFTVTGSTVPVNGAYLPAANTYGIATNTTLRLSVSTTAVTSTLPINGPAGAVGAPTFTGTDTDTGMYFSAANTIDFAGNGRRILQLNSFGTGAYWQLDGGASEITSRAAGTSTDINISLSTKGTGVHGFYSGDFAAKQFQISHTAGATNYPYVAGENAGAPTFGVTGASTNINMQFITKGTGLYTFYSDGSNANALFQVQRTASADSFLSVKPGAGGAKSALIVNGNGASNADLGLTPLGSGVLDISGTANVDAGLASTHSLNVKIGGATFKIPLVSVP